MCARPPCSVYGLVTHPGNTCARATAVWTCCTDGGEQRRGNDSFVS